MSALVSLRRFLPALVVSAEATGLGVRLFLLISKYSVNLPFGDQWDLYLPLFARFPFWRLFFWQHGPHRQGIGFVLDKLLLDFTDWNARAEAFFVGGLIFTAMLLALLLKRKLFGGSLAIPDALIPLIFLTPGQWETLIVAPNPSLAAFPLVLTMLYCLAWLQENPLTKYGFVLLLNFLLIYTGFGFFIGLITVALLALECFESFHRKTRRSTAPRLALILAVGSFFSFFLNYKWMPAVDCFSFPHARPWEYPWFISLMFANIFGVRHDLVFASFLGMACLLFAVVVLAENAAVVWRETPARSTNLVIAILVGYSLLFSLGTAGGRVCLGIKTAPTSRYVTLLIPGLLGIYFHLLSRPDWNRRRVLVAVFFFLLPGSVQSYAGEMRYFAERKRLWKDCYLKSENVEFCNQITKFKIYWWAEGMHLQERLQYLKENRLSFYAKVKGISVQTTSTLNGNRVPFGFVDLAVNANDDADPLLPGDPVRIEGWAADPEKGAPLSRVEVRIDGVTVGNATLGLLRADVAAAFGRADFVRSGWVLTVNVSQFVKGIHTVTVVAFDSRGNASVLSGEHNVTIVSPP